MRTLAHDVLTKIFGYTEFRGDQEAIIERTLVGASSVVLMPTGQGKSLCYQIPARIKGFTLVVSPLIALMKDQVDQAMRLGFRACFINSSLTAAERDERYKRLANRDYELVYVAPERFRKSEFWQALASCPVQVLAIDEAHCISQWGHDFRPDFTRLGEYRERLNRPTTLALTATATPDVQTDIVSQLGLQPSEVQVFQGGMARDNLFLARVPLYGMDQKIQAIVGLRARFPGPLIVYFSLIETLERMADQLYRLGLPLVVYHGKMSARERRAAQEAFLSAQDGLILATPAFGLGINKANVRGVIHAELPGSIEAYYQEVGRAGRDGNPAHCVLLDDDDDISIQTDFIKWANPGAEFIRSVYQTIARQPGKVQAFGLDYLRSQMNFYNSRDFRLETALNLLERWDCLEMRGAGRGLQIDLIRPPDESDVDDELLEIRKKSQQKKLLQLVQMLKGSECRRQSIYRYFGLEPGSPCGQCDVCKPEFWRSP